ncbi:hypothetical protein [Acinetobacter haemolyticus]|uniref:hypothetical protein n=1 Tax=Acinetobacter haemolyticus TaxID=29430 RepID=UPI002DBC5442|nr:hypothetical protein [Acinetobacter haemolyticus]MEB6676474.1 hypothetical protein [Acinetobacter haemolyticus]
MKSILIVTILLFLIACSDDKTKEINSTESIKHQVKVEPVIEQQDDRISIKFINNEEDPLIAVLENKKNINLESANDTQEKIICLGQTLNDWYTFDETLEKPSCKKMNNIGKINNYQCSIDYEIFGLNFQGITITGEGRNIIAFKTLDQCDEALEMWEANAY